LDNRKIAISECICVRFPARRYSPKSPSPKVHADELTLARSAADTRNLILILRRAILPKMGIYDAQNFIPKLDSNRSNFFQWNAAMVVYRRLHDCSEILAGTKRCPNEPDLSGIISEPPPLDVSMLNPLDPHDREIMSNRWQFDDDRRSVNANVKKEAKKQRERICYWRKMDGALIITFISSLPREVLEAIQGLDTAALQYAEVVRRY
jgi:hypothetical protein